MMRKGQMSWLGLVLIMVNIAIVVGLLLMGIAHAAAAEPQLSTSMWKQELRAKYPDGLPWATLNATQVNFRTGPGTEYRVVANWSAKIAVEVLGEQDGWYQVLHWTSPDPMWVWGEYLDMV